MHRHIAAHDATAERFVDRLIAETDAEERDGLVRADQLNDAPRARRRAGTGRDDDRLRPLSNERNGIEDVIADNAHRAAGEALDLLH